MAPRDDDMDWLYRNEPDVPEPEPTARFRPEEIERYRRSDSYPQQPVDSRPHASGGGASNRPPRPPAPPASQPPPRKQRKRRPVAKTISLLLGLWLVFLIAAPVYAWSVTTKVDDAPSGERPAEQAGTTVLLVGSDARDDLTSEERAKLGTGSTEGRRTDTMMLLHIPTKGEPVLLSLPRDSLVDIPGHKRNKLNAAYAFGGAPLLVQTVEQDTGVRIDGYLEIGFLGIVEVVDAVGGITVCPTFDIDDKDAHLRISKGCQTVDGVTALGYVRMRKSDPRGDLGRMERQREVIAAIGKSVLNPMSVINPVRYWNLNQAAAKSLARGETTGIGTMAQVASGFVSVMTGKGISMTVPIADANAKVSGLGSVVRWDDGASAEVFKALSSGDTTSLEKYRK